jgi:type I restriction-modification system DNA methylase subunit
MCFYERIDFLCGDHRWGTMRQQCPREYRTGESCRGVKLSHDDYINKVDKRCHVCEALEIKERKYQKEFSSLMRWQEQQKCGVRRGASIEKALETLQELEREIVELNNKRTSVNRRL